MILVVDNYDSFTFNLVQALQAAGADVRVIRNDAIDRAGVEALADDPEAHLRGIVISPGPGDPDDAGVSMDTILVAADRGIPLLGVCLGMQSMAQAFGATIVRAPDARPRRGVARSRTTAPACSRACRHRSWPRATTPSRSIRRRCPRSCGSPR